MVRRLLSPSKNSSFFLFGARGTGKSTFIEQQWLPTLKSGRCLQYDLLDDDVEERLARSPNKLVQDIEACDTLPEWVVIDEVQKVPRLLDVVQSVIVKKKIKFLLSGSSARKLKKEGANLLAGRAFDYRLYPFSFVELADSFNADHTLNFGALPSVFNFSDSKEKSKYLASYVRNYVRLEVQMEQLLRKLDPFRSFLEVAAQMNGKMLNFSKIAKGVGVDTKTVQNYYSILEDTYLGFVLPAYHTSVRKSQLVTPRFYFFDIGVKRTLDNSIHSPVVQGTSFYGETFEHMVVLEFLKLNSYLERGYRLSFFATKEGAEMDLLLSRGRELILIEIKSAARIDETEVKKMLPLMRETKAKAYYLSQDPNIEKIDGVMCMPWMEGIKRILAV
ncbi:MAG: ATP-binding protein [Pseudobdellovibrionaceae bacterium]|nr:ATP-binding protein [Bdellovibrionales bacterium]USN47501.1 MAG: ATP-binding protein [Pseudobdellovibrionaceae bacterium]